MALTSRLMGTGLPPAVAAQIVGDVGANLTATGTTQATALLLSNGVNYVTTTASGTGVRLYGLSTSPSSVGDEQTVYNYGANALSVYPPVGETILGLSQNEAFSLSTSSIGTFEKVTSTTWICKESFVQSGSAPSGGYSTATPVQTVVREILGDRPQRMQAILDAARIRANAGVPAGIQIGRSLTAGPSGTLSSDSQVSITQESHASALASSGTGTISDPYVINLTEILQASGTTAYGFRWADAAATYYIRLEDFNIGGWGTAQIEVNTATRLHLKRGTLSTNSNGDLTTAHCLRILGGTIIAEQVDFDSGLGFIIENRSRTSSIHFIECQIDGAVTALRPGFSISDDFSEATIRVERCTFGGSSVGIAANYDTRLELIQCKFEETLSHPFRATYDANMREDHKGPSGYARYCQFDGAVTDEPVYMEVGDGFKFEYCEFLDTPANQRLFFAFGSVAGTARNIFPRDIELFRCYGTRTTGTAVAGNEMFESWDCSGIKFKECWVEDAPEDGFEHVDGINCTVEWCVGDNVAGEIVDFFGTGGKGGYVHHIYGDGAIGVVVTDVDGVIIHDIYTDNSGSDRDSTWGNVTLERRNASSGVSPANCKVYGPLPLPASSAHGQPFKIKGTAGTGNEAVYFSGDAFVTSGSPDTTNLVVR